MTSPNRLKIHKLFDDAHSTQNLWINASHRFAEVFKAMNWEWTVWDGPNHRSYVPNHSHIYQTIKNLLIDLKIMIDGFSGPIRRNETFYMRSGRSNETFYMCSGRIVCRIFFEDSHWRLSINLEVNGSEFIA